jgi:hypothetical protein
MATQIDVYSSSWRYYCVTVPLLRAASHMRLTARDFEHSHRWKRWSRSKFASHETESPWPLHSKYSHWWKRWSWSKFASREGPTEYVCECKGGCEVYMDSYMALNGICFMVTWIIFKNCLLKVGLTQNRETMALQMLTIVGFFFFL